MVSFEATSVSAAKPETIWRLWADVPRWSDAEHMVKAELRGPFAPGSTIRSKAKGLPASTLRITSVDEPLSWVDEARSPGLRMTFDHILEPTPSGTVVTERARLDGLLAPIAGAILGRKLRALLKNSTRYLAEAATDEP
jgi:hypothetical protein